VAEILIQKEIIFVHAWKNMYISKEILTQCNNGRKALNNIFHLPTEVLDVVKMSIYQFT
jgi:hypothetical protein